MGKVSGSTPPVPSIDPNQSLTSGFPTVCALTDWAPLALADSWAMRSRLRASWKDRDRWRRIYEKHENHP
jgi:hypothetical protein